MKKKIVTLFALSVLTGSSFAQRADTVSIDAKSLKIANLNTGKQTYIVYNKKNKDSPSERITIVKIDVESIVYNGKAVISITQNWEMDTTVHTANTFLSANDFSTIQHNFYWKKSAYSSKYDFETKKVLFEGNVLDSLRGKSIADFNNSFNSYNLNWHSDLIIFPLLPYKKNRTFKINFYDPGFGKAKEVFYTVMGSEFLKNSSGGKIKCWVMKHETSSAGGYQKFWVSQKTSEILKEQDSFNGRLRYKLKMLFTEDN